MLLVRRCIRVFPGCWMLLAVVLGAVARLPALAQGATPVSQLLDAVKTAGQSKGYNPQNSALQDNLRAVSEENQFRRQRTPAAELPTPGGAQVAALENFLAGRFAVFVAADSLLIMPPAQQAAYAAALKQVQDYAPTWNTADYEEEAAYYQRKDAEEQAYRQQLQAAWQRRAQRLARRDSVARRARR